MLLAISPALAARQHDVAGVACGGLRPERVGNEFGIAASEPVLGQGVSMCGNGKPLPGNVSPAAPYQGSPPLVNHGGPVMFSGRTVGAVTITPIYWAPSGYSFPAGYEPLVNQFVSDSATDSGLPTNALAALIQYTGPGAHHLNYSITAGSPITVTAAFPASGGCTADSGAVYSDNSGYRA